MSMRSGFFMLEIVIYCTLLCMLSVLSFHFFAQSSQLLKNYRTVSSAAIMEQLTRSLLRRDMVAACGDWQQKPNQLSWRIAQGRVRWKCKNNTLYRSFFAERSKKRKTSAVVARGVSSCSWHVEDRPRNITQIACTITYTKGHSLVIRAASYNQHIGSVEIIQPALT